MKKTQLIKSLASLDVDKYVRKAVGRCEENVKIKIVIPLLELLGYSVQQHMDFEHHVADKRADIALSFDSQPKLFVESKDLDENLDDHIHQALNYAFDKGVEWVILTNGIEIRVYKSFIPNIPHKDRKIFSTTLSSLPQTFDELFEFVGRDSLQEAKKLTEKAESVRENITAEFLINDLSECRKRLFSDLFTQFKARYETDSKFKETIDSWAADVKMDISAPALIEKLCKEGAYTLINRVLFLRICEDRGHIKAKLSKDAITKWREMVENPASLLAMAFMDISKHFEGLYKSPLFDAINYEDIDWDKNTIDFIIDRLGEHDFSTISKDILGKAYEQHISREERKQLGQFYTPDFVIDYILDRVGVSPEKKILDPACGSGGFLMKAYDRLRKQYLDKGWAEEVIHQHILRNNLYGIDINPFASQLTVMNLLLKDLDHPAGEINVVDGDSLDKTHDGLDMDILHKEAPLSRVAKPDKKTSLVGLLRNRPFDIVVGNPPYLRPHKIGEATKRRLWKSYKTYQKKVDIYSCFVERGLELLNEGGYLGFITSDTWLTIDSFANLRKHILDSCKVVSIATPIGRVFDFATVNTTIFILQKDKVKSNRRKNIVSHYVITHDNNGQFVLMLKNKIPQRYFLSTYQNILDLTWSEQIQRMKKKAYSNSKALEKVLELSFGLKTGDDSLFLKKKLTSENDKRLLRRSDFSRYCIDYKGEYVRYEPDEMVAHRKTARPGEEARFEQPKILVQDISRRIVATYDEENYYVKDAILIYQKGYPYKLNLEYVLAVLNSKLMQFLYSTSFPSIQVARNELAQLPLKTPSPSNQKMLSNLVDKMLSLNEQLNDPTFVKHRDAIQKEIDATDTEINRKVYDLYGLTEDEIKIVESQAS